MKIEDGKKVLILGANSDVAKQAILQYSEKGFNIIAASRDTNTLQTFVIHHKIDDRVNVVFFDAEDFDSHVDFYQKLNFKPHIVIYAAGYLIQNKEALINFEGTHRMMKVNYIGAVSILNIIATDISNNNLERIIGLSSLSGVRGRKSNFVYGSTKSAFTQYLAGLRQELSGRNIVVNALVIGYINTKINKGLKLNKSLMMEPTYVAKYIVNAGKSFTIVPNIKWKFIYLILKYSPEWLVSKLP